MTLQCVLSSKLAVVTVLLLLTGKKKEKRKKKTFTKTNLTYLVLQVAWQE